MFPMTIPLFPEVAALKWRRPPVLSIPDNAACAADIDEALGPLCNQRDKAPLYAGLNCPL